MKFTEEKTTAMKKHEKQMIAFLKKNPSSPYSKICHECKNLEIGTDIEGKLSWSDWKLCNLKKKAGIKKITALKRGKDKQLLILLNI